MLSVFCTAISVTLLSFQSSILQVYKSASKRKAHILKNHPGAALPPSIRKLRPAGPGEPDPMLSTHTQLTGTIATPPVCCPHCSKQYSSKVRWMCPCFQTLLLRSLPPSLSPSMMSSYCPCNPSIQGACSFIMSQINDFELSANNVVSSLVYLQFAKEGTV